MCQHTLYLASFSIIGLEQPCLAPPKCELGFKVGLQAVC